MCVCVCEAYFSTTDSWSFLTSDSVTQEVVIHQGIWVHSQRKQVDVGGFPVDSLSKQTHTHTRPLLVTNMSMCNLHLAGPFRPSSRTLKTANVCECVCVWLS